MKNKHYQALVIGGGFAGLATAYFLAKKGVGKIALVEKERRLGAHASGRNAGMIRQAISDPFICLLAKEGRNRLKNLAKNGDFFFYRSFKLSSQGSLLLGKKGLDLELEKIRQATNKSGVYTRWLDRKQASALVELLDEGDFDRALLCPGDGVIDIDLLVWSFSRVLRRLGVKMVTHFKVKRIKRMGDGFAVSSNNGFIVADKIINAAGAWASFLGERAGASKIPLIPYRRHLFYCAKPKGFKAAWPFVWDLSRDFYFRPEKNDWLLSPCDKVLCKISANDKQFYGEKTDLKTKRLLDEKLSCFSKKLKLTKVRRLKTGLRTLTPDGRFVIGEDPRLKGFYWAAGLGGHGVTTCFAVGRLAADLILGKKRPIDIINVFSPKRFYRAKK